MRFESGTGMNHCVCDQNNGNPTYWSDKLQACMCMNQYEFMNDDGNCETCPPGTKQDYASNTCIPDCKGDYGNIFLFNL